MNSLDKLKTLGKINRKVVSSLYKNGDMIKSGQSFKSYKNGKPIAKEVHVEAHQAYEFAAPFNLIYYSAANFSSSIFNSANGKIEVKIDKQSCEKATGVKFRIRLSETGGINPVTVVPIPYLFDRIEFWGDSGSGGMISQHYADTLYWMYDVYSIEQNQILLANANSNERWENGLAIPPNSFVDYYLELPGCWIETVKPYISGLKGDILCRMYTRNGVVSSGNGTLGLSQIDLILEHEDLDGMDSQLHLSEYENKIFRHTFLDVIQVSEAKTCTASSETKISLENLVGKCAFMLFCLRSGSSPQAASNGLTSYVDITDACQVDLLGPQNQKLLGHGTALYAKEIKSLLSKHFQGNLPKYKNVYIIPFCNNAMQAFTGAKDGYMYFQGENNTLSLTFPAAGINEVQTITLTNSANNSGYYQLSYRGHVTDSLAFNASTSTMAAALNALPTMIEDGLTASFSGTAAATFTVTFAPPKPVAYRNGQSNNLVRIIPTSLNQGGTFEIGSSSVTTIGKVGWVTGTYVIDSYSFIFKDLYVNDGRIKTAED